MRDPRPHLGAVYGAQASPDGLIPFALKTQELGLGQLWVVEDCFLSGGMTLAASALAVTDRLRLGVGLLPAPLRNPALAAMEIGTLARAHPGRFTAVFGHGVRGWMQQIGALPTRRLVALEEVVSAVRSLLAGHKMDLEESYVTLREVALELGPEVTPDVLVGSTGPRGLEIGARVSDGILLPEGCGPDFVRWAARSGEAGRPRRCVVYAWLALDDDADIALDKVAPALRKWSLSEHYPLPRRHAGLSESPAVLAEGDLRGLAERVSVTGNPAACADAITRLFDAGADDVILVPQGEDPLAELERVMGEVVPLLARDPA